MKKLLLGTTALIAAGAFVGAAQAADDDMMAGPVTVGVAGYTVTAAVGFASDDMDGDGNPLARPRNLPRI